MAISDADRLLARGAEITLKDGRAFPLVFDFEALHLIEQEFGGMGSFAERLGQADQRLDTALQGITAGFIHLWNDPDVARRPFKRNEIVRLLDYRRLRTYYDAMTEALNQGLPEPSPGEVPDPNSAGSPARSLGPATTDSQPAMVGATASSGA